MTQERTTLSGVLGLASTTSLLRWAAYWFAYAVLAGLALAGQTRRVLNLKRLGCLYGPSTGISGTNTPSLPRLSSKRQTRLGLHLPSRSPFLSRGKIYFFRNNLDYDSKTLKPSPLHSCLLGSFFGQYPVFLWIAHSSSWFWWDSPRLIYLQPKPPIDLE